MAIAHTFGWVNRTVARGGFLTLVLLLGIVARGGNAFASPTQDSSQTDTPANTKVGDANPKATPPGSDSSDTEAASLDQDKTKQPQWQQLDSAELLTQAHAASYEATTESALRTILEQCAELRSRDLADQQRQHATRLAAWANFQLAETLLDQSSAVFLTARRKQQASSTIDEQNKSERSASLEAANGLTEEAITRYTASYADDPTLLPAKFGLGVAQAMLGQYAEAEASFAFVVEANPKHAEAHFNRAECLSQLEKADAAIKSYSSAIELRPQDPAIYAGRGHAYLVQGSPEKALLDYKRCLQMQPHNARAMVNRGDAYLQLGKWEAALNDYMMARGEEPSFVIPCQRMAWVMATSPDLKLRNESGAYELAVEAIKLNGKANALLMDTLAATQAANGWFADAEATLKQAKELDPQGFDERAARRLELYQAERPYVDQPTIR